MKHLLRDNKGQIGAMIVLIAVALIASAVATLPDSEFKAGIVAYHNPLDSYKLTEEDFSRIAGNGIGWISVDFAWRDIEPEKGYYDFSYYDFVTEEAEKNGLRIVAKIGNGYNGNRPVVPEWAKDLGDEEYNEALGNYARDTAQRYGWQIEYYAMENEPNVAENHVWNGWRVGEWSEARVVSILETLEKSIREGDPDCKLVLSVSTCNAGDWIGWIQRVSERVNFDAIGLQAYPCIFNPDPDKAYDIVWDIESAKVFGKEVMILETGYHTYFRSEKNQAEYVENAFTAAKSGGASGIFFYEYLDNSEEPSGSERNFGLLRENREPKPAWERYGKVIESG